MEKLELRGLSCPEPVLRVQRAAARGETEMEAWVDNPAAKENILRFAGARGFSAAVAEADGAYVLTLKK